MPENCKSRLSQVEMFLHASFPNWATMMMLYGRNGFNLVSSIIAASLLRSLFPLLHHYFGFWFIKLFIPLFTPSLPCCLVHCIIVLLGRATFEVHSIPPTLAFCFFIALLLCTSSLFHYLVPCVLIGTSLSLSVVGGRV
jgi:hypothetical protein